MYGCIVYLIIADELGNGYRISKAFRLPFLPFAGMRLNFNAAGDKWVAVASVSWSVERLEFWLAAENVVTKTPAADVKLWSDQAGFTVDKELKGSPPVVVKPPGQVSKPAK